jgi:hypothetical protein
MWAATLDELRAKVARVDATLPRDQFPTLV